MSLEEEKAQLRALAHPVRIRILSLLTSAELTAADVARELDLTHANASYHLRALLHTGTIEVAGEERIRGGMAKRYRYDIDRQLRRDFPPEREGRPGTDDRRLVLEAFAGELRRRSADFMSAEHNLVADAEFWVDPDVWQDVHDRISAAVADLHHAARPPRTPGTLHTSTTVALFRMADR
ncbi:MAG TPA: helix-turn-helix domain-containing protein [Actinoplanes sp.]|nr:helix-turn-helix domain-containing protein [Actinoplanes sp.]